MRCKTQVNRSGFLTEEVFKYLCKSNIQPIIRGNLSVSCIYAPRYTICVGFKKGFLIDWDEIGENEERSEQS